MKGIKKEVKKKMKITAGGKFGSYKYRMIMLIFTLLAVWCFWGCGADEETASSAVVRIDLGASAASGVVYECTEENLVVVTASHVLKDYSAGASAANFTTSVKVIWGETTVTASELYVSENSETAFISIPLGAIPEEIAENLQVVSREQVRFDLLKEGDVVLMKGFSADGELLEISGALVYSWIYAEDFAQYMMLVDGESFPGMSGGGVFDEAGNLVGILCGVNDAGESAVVPLSIIVAEYIQAYPEAG